ncbi:helix-turn-helix domain-containing protein [Lactobacillus kefiranofaciens]|uniref:helix-turn-helix domain-containing protein n=1 Tax=Lactobacillus kefiranofaciens TaxID=267818 RepID=UPI001F2D87F0|nr:helix-turn-helix domain-containing protein [Lactobacillus kefiranofaciens]
MVTHGFKKKSEKMPQKELEKALKRRKLYEEKYGVKKISFLDKYIDKKIKQNPKLEKEFARYVGKPQSTISRIESGSMNVSIGLLNEIANSAHRQIKLVLV